MPFYKFKKTVKIELPFVVWASSNAIAQKAASKFNSQTDGFLSTIFLGKQLHRLDYQDDDTIIALNTPSNDPKTAVLYSIADQNEDFVHDLIAQAILSVDEL